MKGKRKWILGAVVVVIGFLVIAGIVGAATGWGDKEETAKGNASPTALQSPATTPTAAAQPTTAPPSWSEGAPITDDSSAKALADSKEMTRSLNLGETESIQIDGSIVTVTYKTKDALSETDLLTIGAQTSFSAHRVLFTNPQVTSVTVIMLADWADQLGNTASEVTTVSTLDRATADQIDWDGLENRVLLDNKDMFCISDAYRIHIAIYSRLKDTGCLAGPIQSE